MLILSRKLNEQIIISDKIIISIQDIDKDKVKIGIEAPKDIKIFRKELIEDIKHSNIESTKTSTDSLRELKKKLSNNFPNK